MYAGCRNQRPRVSTYEAGWSTNQIAIGNPTAAAAPAAHHPSRTVRRRARARPIAAVAPTITTRNAPEGCAYAHTASAAAAIAHHQGELASVKRFSAISE